VTFSRFATTLTCDTHTQTHTHRQRDRHTMMAIIRTSLAPRG